MIESEALTEFSPVAKLTARHYDKWKSEASYGQMPILDSNRV